jgi:hypothetical protein
MLGKLNFVYFTQCEIFCLFITFVSVLIYFSHANWQGLYKQLEQECEGRWMALAKLVARLLATAASNPDKK